MNNDKSWHYNWKPLPKPWHWVFTFWRSCWKNYGEFEPISPEDSRYEEACYEMGFICKLAPKYEGQVLDSATKHLRSNGENHP
jgi:hypothetical protein